MKHLLFLIIVSIYSSSIAQTDVTLEQCYELAHKNYPLMKQNQLLEEKNTLEKKSLGKSKLPTLEINAQATYQSDVTHVPIESPAFSIPSPNKGQYKANATVTQLIYSGGIINNTIDAKSDELLTQQKQVEVSLYQLNKQINHLYYSILLIQEKKELVNAYRDQLLEKKKEVKAGIEYGAITKNAVTSIEIEEVKLNQYELELNKSKQSLMATLSKIIGVELNEKSILQSTDIKPTLDLSITRPEIDLFQLQKNQITSNERVLAKKNAPKLLAFGTSGLGNPGLNMLDNSLQPYYMVGVQFKWNVFDWNANRIQRTALLINKEIISNQQELFLLNTSIELQQFEIEIEKIMALIETDKIIIELQRKIVKTADSQLKNGVIQPSVYVNELTNLFEAENKLSTHQIELQIAKANYKTTKGN